MATYTVRDNQSDKTVTFQWDSLKPPADEDMEEIFKEAGLREGAEPLPVFPQEKIGKDLPRWAEPVKMGMETVGLVGGGAAGMLAGGPTPAAPALGALGAGAGYAGGSRAYRELMKILGYGEHPALGEESVGRTGTEIATGTGIEVVGQVAGKAIPWGLQKILAPNAEFISSPEGKELLSIYKRFGIEPTPADLAPTSKTTSIMEGVLSYRLFSGDVMLNKSLAKMKALNNIRSRIAEEGGHGRTTEQIGKEIRKEASELISKYKGAKQQQVTGLVDDFMNRIGASEGRYESGAKFSDLMWTEREALANNAKELFSQVSESLPKKGKDIVPLSQEMIDSARNLMKQEMSKPDPLRNNQLIEILKSFGAKERKLPEGVSEMMVQKDPTLRALVEEKTIPKFSWEGLQNTRSELLERIRGIHQTTKGMPTNESRVYGELQENILNDMGTYAEKIGGDTWTIYSQAREASKKMHDIFDKDILRIMNKNSGEVIQSIIRGGKPVLDQIKSAVGDTGIQPLRQGFFKELLESATAKGTLDPKVLSRRLQSMGQETVDAFINSDQKLLLDEIIKKGEFINARIANKAVRFKVWDFLETIADTNNDRVANAIIQPQNMAFIKIAKRVLSPERMQELQSATIGNKVFSVSGTGNFLPISSAKNFQKYSNTLRELMDPAAFKELSDFVSLGQHMNRIEALAKNVSQTGQVLLGSQTGSQLLSSLAKPLSLVKLTLLPWMFGKIYASPQAAKYFTSAAKLPSWSPYAMKSFTQALSVAGINAFEDVEKVEKPSARETLIKAGVLKRTEEPQEIPKEKNLQLKGAFPSVGP